MDPLTRKVRPLQRKKKRKPLSEEISNMYRVLTITLVILGIASTASYLYMNSLKPAKGYTLKQLQLEYEDLQSQQRKLDHRVIEAQSFINIEEEESLDEMESINNDDVSYVDDSNYAQQSSKTTPY